MPQGKIKFFNANKGFGFIIPDDGGADMFFHVSELREGDEITEGVTVQYEVGTDRKTGRPSAHTVDRI